MAVEPAADAAALRRALDLLNRSLVESRRRLSAEARASREVLDEVGRKAAEAAEELGRIGQAAASVAEADRLELMREAAAARASLAVIAKLAAGGMRFASLTRELSGTSGGGLYGPAGAPSKGTAARSVERKV